MYMCIYIYIYVYMCIYIYIYIYVYIYIYIYILTESLRACHASLQRGRLINPISLPYSTLYEIAHLIMPTSIDMSS